MISLLRKVFGRAGEIPAPDEDPIGVGIIDGTEAGVGTLLGARLAADGLPTRLVHAADLPAAGECTVLLLPARTPILSDSAMQIVSVIDALAADPDTSTDFPGRIVLTWCVTHPDRPRFAAPSPVSRNWSTMLLGTAWARELACHAGDARAAATCRSAQIGRLMHAHGAVAGIRTTDLCRGVRRLDPQFLHAMAIKPRDNDLTNPQHRWLGLSAIAAAVRVRLDEPG